MHSPCLVDVRAASTAQPDAPLLRCCHAWCAAGAVPGRAAAQHPRCLRAAARDCGAGGARDGQLHGELPCWCCFCSNGGGVGCCAGRLLPRGAGFHGTACTTAELLWPCSHPPLGHPAAAPLRCLQLPLPPTAEMGELRTFTQWALRKLHVLHRCAQLSASAPACMRAHLRRAPAHAAALAPGPACAALLCPVDSPLIPLSLPSAACWTWCRRPSSRPTPKQRRWWVACRSHAPLVGPPGRRS